MTLRLQIIVGSTRAGRAADRVLPWALDRAGAHDAFDVDLLDLRDWPLPMFAETAQTIGDIENPTYSEPIVREWNQRIKQGDAYLFVTPEYNHSTTGVLKNAIDNVFVSWAFRNKPAAAISYSNGIAGGVRAIEHLAAIAIEVELAPLKNSVVIPRVASAFEGTEPNDPTTDIALQIVLDDLAWWGSALKTARDAGQHRPGTLRMRAALARLSS